MVITPRGHHPSFFNRCCMNHLTIEERPSVPSGSSLYTIHGGWLIVAWSFIYMFSAWWIRTSVLTDEVYLNSVGAHADQARVYSLIELQHRFGPLIYSMVPVGLLLRAAAVAFCLLAGALLGGHKLSFGTAFKISLFAESAFVAYALLKLLLLAFSHPISRLQDMQEFAPLSLYSILPPGGAPRWLMYPLQTLNLFEIAYWFLLAAGLRYFLGQPLGKMLALVISTYGIALLGWITSVEFLTINAS